MNESQRVFKGRYKEIGPLGKGGSASVILARDTETQRLVAVKEPLAKFAGDKEVNERFENEGFVGLNCRHPAAITVFDFGKHAGVPYIVMEYLEGLDVERAIKQYGAIPSKAACHIVFQVAQALMTLHSHERQFIHRDVKPGNIYLLSGGWVDQGLVKLMDFGLVRQCRLDTKPKPIDHQTRVNKNVTGATFAVGTEGFMSPEQQISAEDIDGRSDIYSLVVTLWFMIRGSWPNKLPKLWSIDRLDHPLLEGIPVPLRPLIMGACQGFADAGLRAYPSAEAFAVALLAAAKQLPNDGSTDFWQWTKNPNHAARFETRVMPAARRDEHGNLVEVSPDEASDNQIERLPTPKWAGQDDHVTVSAPPPSTWKWIAPVAAGAVSALTLVFVGVWMYGQMTSNPSNLIAANSAPSPSNSSTILTNTTTDAPSLAMPTAFAQTVSGYNDALDVAPTPPPVVSISKKEPKPAAPKKVEAVMVVKTDTTPTKVATPPSVAPPLGEGQVRLLGKPAAAHLTSESGGGTFSIPGKVPPGLYRIGAKFQGDDTFKDFGTVKIEPGAAVTIRCDTAFGTCQ